MATVHGCLPILAAARSSGTRLCFSVSLAVLLYAGLDSLALAAEASPTLAPVYWQHRLFFIPYQVNQPNGTASQIAKVQLLMSRDGATDWRTLQEAAPNVRGFGYHAPEDGEYWFALRHLDQQGKPWPNGIVQPQIRIAVDTVEPTLQVKGTLGKSGTLALRYEANDSNLRPESLVLEARAAGSTWSRVQLGPPDASQGDHLEGRANWVYPHLAKSVEIRASIVDKAGHHSQAAAEVTIAGPAFQMPATGAAPIAPETLISSETKGPPSGASADPFLTTSKLAARDWPANNRLTNPANSLAASPNRPEVSRTQLQPRGETPPLLNPYTTAGNRGGNGGPTSAQLIGDRGQFKPLTTPNAVAGTLEKANPIVSIGASGWGPPPGPTPMTGLSDRMVNSLAFDIEYDLQSVGPWGVSKVELWGTHDGGKTWQSYSVDSDNRSPVRVSVPDEGVYGFRILVDGVNSVEAAPPRSGEKPELIVAVDLQAPRAELVSTELGKGNLADHLLLRWAVEDRNLERRPIGLFYSSYPNGPWSTIATGLENTGAYTWRLQRHMPNQFYVRLEARDMAGNLATDQTSAPISLSRPQPTGRLRSVRPIGR